MARAGRALKRVLENYGISQNQLATTMGIDRSNVSRWVSGSRDPSAEAVAEIKQALGMLREPAAEDFVRYYLYEPLPEEIVPMVEVAIEMEVGNLNHHQIAPLHLLGDEVLVAAVALS
jgi:transcriptional regulator with XRE-family HTH domain